VDAPSGLQAAGSTSRCRHFGVRRCRCSTRSCSDRTNGYNLGVSHELIAGVAVTAEWFRSDFKDMIARNNVARNIDSYNKVVVANPIDGTTIDAYVPKAAMFFAYIVFLIILLVRPSGLIGRKIF
jgi:branched-subunit amino acid ABC-type transport system permease component